MSLTESTPEAAAKAASYSARSLATLPSEARNEALTAIYDALSENRDTVLAANAKDMELALRASKDGQMRSSLVKRLDLSRPGKYDDMLQGILDVRKLEDPIGKIDLRTLLDDNLELTRVSCPIGVLLIIFEARPEVIANIAALAIKSGNAAILKGGKESTESFRAISTVISKTLESTQVPNAAIQLVQTRDVIDQLLALDKYIDLVIPRGGNDLVTYVKSHTKIPVLGHADGLCTIYINSDADKDMAVKLVLESKCDYPAGCNAVETLLVHEDVLSTILPSVAEALLTNGVSLRCDEQSKAVLKAALPASSAVLLQDVTEEDYNTEYTDLILAIKTIPSSPTDGHTATPSPIDPSLTLAITHINTHSSHHTDCIITSSSLAAETFMSAVDSAGVYWNASTRFADGMRYGFGTEVGISTNKIHARGPVGLEGLTVYKYKLRGGGQGIGDYKEGGRRYLHKRLPVEGRGEGGSV
jgi:glutamate-5-semialdehyde dehydrogenase